MKLHCTTGYFPHKLLSHLGFLFQFMIWMFIIYFYIFIFFYIYLQLFAIWVNAMVQIIYIENYSFKNRKRIEMKWFIIEFIACVKRGYITFSKYKTTCNLFRLLDVSVLDILFPASFLHFFVSSIKLNS